MKKLHEYKTPLTDEAWAAWPYAGPGVHANFARDLERKLALATDALREIANTQATRANIGWMIPDNIRDDAEEALREIENADPQG
jgi:hypothetical protein